MTLHRVELDQVFDGRTNYATRAIVRLDIEGFAQDNGYRLESGVDGLDSFLAIPLELVVKPPRHRPAVHTGIPNNALGYATTCSSDFARSDGSPVADPVRFALWRHAGNPVGQTAIYLPLNDPWRREIELIVAELGLRQSDLIWVDASSRTQNES